MNLKIQLNLAPAKIERKDLTDGAFVLRSPVPLGKLPNNVCQYLCHWGSRSADHPFLVEQGRVVTYGVAHAAVRALAQSFIDCGATVDRPVMILSDNSVENALWQLAALYVGLPVVPVSPSYSLVVKDPAKVRHIHELINPALIFAEDGQAFSRVLGALDLKSCQVVIKRNAPEGMPVTQFNSLLETKPGEAVDQAFNAVHPDTTAKILFTSGSTGFPKGVINTHRMIAANQEAMNLVWPFLNRRPPVLVDWLPWHHTYGGNLCLMMALRNGGTFHIDKGKPTPDGIAVTLATLRGVSPTVHFNVPRGIEAILPYLEEDEALRRTFFAELDVIAYAAAALPENIWRRLRIVADRAGANNLLLASGWGATETAPAVTFVHQPVDRSGVIGLPLPGTELKMVPCHGKLEMRVRGPNVTPGYYRDAEKTREAFDEDGFYIIGDAGRLADPDDPSKGIVFDGRVAENFKLSSGTWVNVGNLRVALIAACQPIIQDAVVCGHDRNTLGLLVFPNLEACAALGSDEAVISALRDAITRYNAENGSSSVRIARLLLLNDPPSLEAGEITDKGYINQRAVLDRRAEQVSLLYAGEGGAIVFD